MSAKQILEDIGSLMVEREIKAGDHNDPRSGAINLPLPQWFFELLEKEVYEDMPEYINGLILRFYKTKAGVVFRLMHLNRRSINDVDLLYRYDNREKE